MCVLDYNSRTLTLSQAKREGRDLLPAKPRPQRPDTTRLREPIDRRVHHHAPNPMGSTMNHSLFQPLQMRPTVAMRRR